MIVEKVLSYRDEELWREALDREEHERDQLQTVADHWDDIVAEYIVED